MNSKAADALRQAALSGMPQVKYAQDDGNGGHCAVGAISMALIGQCYDYWTLAPLAGFKPTAMYCPVCKSHQSRNEGWLIAHLNNDHSWDFLTIANKLEVPDDLA